MRKIDLLVPSSSPYGISIIVDKLKLALESRGYVVNISDGCGEETSYTIPISISPGLKSRGLGGVAVLIDSPSLTASSVLGHSLKYALFDAGFIKQILKFVHGYLTEFRLFFKYRYIVVVSPVDVLHLSRLYGKIAKIILAKNGIDLPSKPVRGTQHVRNPIRLGFISSFSDGAFRDIDWFLKKIWSELSTKERSNFEIVVAGRGSEKYRKTLERYQNVKVVGAVDSVDGFYSDIDFSLATIRKKSGILNKVLESFSYGVPVIGVPYNFKSVSEFQEGEHYLVFRGVGSFKKVLTLLLNDNGFEFCFESAIRLLEKHYIWERNYETLLDVVDRDFDATYSV